MVKVMKRLPLGGSPDLSGMRDVNKPHLFLLDLTLIFLYILIILFLWRGIWIVAKVRITCPAAR
jgi:hypothetical protein